MRAHELKVCDTFLKLGMNYKVMCITEGQFKCRQISINGDYGGFLYIGVNSQEKIILVNRPEKRKVVQMDLRGYEIEHYDSIVDAHRKTGIRETGISDCIHGRLKQSGGYKWKVA